jgi:hypothetical protein
MLRRASSFEAQRHGRSHISKAHTTCMYVCALFVRRNTYTGQAERIRLNEYWE